MAQRDLVIGLDCSTTAVKAVVWDAQGIAQASSRAVLPVHKPRPSWHEQPAEAWWEATQQCLREAAAKVDSWRLAAICIAPQRETFVLTDARGKPLHEALLWMDERCRDLLAEIDQMFGKSRIHAETGKPLSANLTLGKLLWLSRNMPELNQAGTRVNDVHAFLAQRLSGRFVTSWGCADPTGLFDMQHNRWNTELIRITGFNECQFPEAVEPGTIISEVLDQVAQACGLPAHLALVAGLGDGQAAGLGVGVTQAGEAYVNLGTAVVSGTYSAQYLHDPAFRTMYGGIPGSYILETVLLGGTYTISWFLEQFGGVDPRTLPAGMSAEALLEREASQVPPGANGLTLVPYWNSAMNPYWNAAASGIVVGWRGIHGRAHLYRAILEGIAFELRLQTQGVERALALPIERLIAVGGGARSKLWLQVIADICARPVFVAEAAASKRAEAAASRKAEAANSDIHETAVSESTEAVEATALGAGILAAAAVGLHPDPGTAARAMTRISAEAYRPEQARVEFYRKLYEDIYQHLYPALQPYLDRLAQLAD